MKASALDALLEEFTKDKLALRERHLDAALRVGNYDFNNAYQYVINREDTQVGWLVNVLTELGRPIPAVDLPSPASEGTKDVVQQATIAEDVRQQLAFVEKWRARVASMPNARHRRMLQVVIDETTEHCRLFEQMAVGQQDVLGRRTGGESTGGGVLPVRWLQ